LERRGLRSADNGENVLGDRVVQSAEDALIDHVPFWIMALVWSRRGGKMGAEAELADEGVEEAAPFVVVRLGELEDNENMGFDVHRLKNSNERRCGGGSVAVDGGLKRRVDRGNVELKQWVDVHGSGDGEQRKEKKAFATVPPNNYEPFIYFDRTVTITYYLLRGNL
jgi:hypothetical protein